MLWIQILKKCTNNSGTKFILHIDWLKVKIKRQTAPMKAYVYHRGCFLYCVNSQSKCNSTKRLHLSWKIKELSVRKSGGNRLKSLKRAKKCNPNKPEKQISQTNCNNICIYYENKIKAFWAITEIELHRLEKYKKCLKFVLILLNWKM